MSRLIGELMWLPRKNKHGFRIYKLYYNYKLEKLEKLYSESLSFCDQKAITDWVRNDSLSKIDTLFNFNNETSSDIQNLHHDLYPISNNGKNWFMSHFTSIYPLTNTKNTDNNYSLEICNDGFHIETDSADNHWIYIVSNKTMPSKYALEFDYNSKTSICEQLQFDIHSTSLANRFRIISEYGKLLFFDAVKDGFFLKRFYEKKSLLPTNTLNHIRLEVFENHILYYVNNNIELSVTINKLEIKPGKLIILFWNREDKAPIDIKISNFSVYTEKLNT